jgi:3-dehydroquinate dehydratase I
VTPTRLIHLRGKPIAGGKLPLICTPLVGRTREEVLAELATVLPKAPDLIEWRVDFFAALGDAQAVIATAHAIRAVAGATPVLFTRRSTREGGQPIALAEADVVRVHEAVCDARCIDMVDWEMSSDAADFARIRAATRANELPLVVSYHNFRRTWPG